MSRPSVWSSTSNSRAQIGIDAEQRVARRVRDEVREREYDEDLRAARAAHPQRVAAARPPCAHRAARRSWRVVAGRARLLHADVVLASAVAARRDSSRGRPPCALAGTVRRHLLDRRPCRPCSLVATTLPSTSSSTARSISAGVSIATSIGARRDLGGDREAIDVAGVHVRVHDRAIGGDRMRLVDVSFGSSSSSVPTTCAVACSVYAVSGFDLSPLIVR